MGRLILVRHGQTDLNKEKVYYGRLDIPINETGKKQAEKTREILETLKIDYDRIYTSTMRRAIETAGILNYKNLLVEQSSLIREMNFGIFEGFTYKELVERFPDKVKKSAEDWKNYSYETGENPVMLQKRAVEFAESLDKSKDNLVVTHWGIICSLLSYYISKDLDGYWKYDIKNGGIAIINFHKGFPVLEGFNIGGLGE